MGWKAVKEHYRIEHIVQVTSAGLCVGSGYIHDLITVDRRVVRSKFRSAVDELGRIEREMNADIDKLVELVEQEDIFERSITVYTYSDGEIIEKQCEEVGWPNVTHDGELMYENSHSTDRAQVLEWAIKDETHGIQMYREYAVEHEAKAKKYQAKAKKYREELSESKKRRARLRAERDRLAAEGID